ncbi:hypothetical protein V1477_001140 [Vespula maculifrons]|uniref:Uncharacterized protein n=1 Tax=Vespula maculifrons TaxID=7453 RepID=A0ABD2CZN3_VESMC
MHAQHDEHGHDGDDDNDDDDDDDEDEEEDEEEEDAFRFLTASEERQKVRTYIIRYRIRYRLSLKISREEGVFLEFEIYRFDAIKNTFGRDRIVHCSKNNDRFSNYAKDFVPNAIAYLFQVQRSGKDRTCASRYRWSVPRANHDDPQINANRCERIEISNTSDNGSWIPSDTTCRGVTRKQISPN